MRLQTTVYLSSCTSRNWSEVTFGFLSRLWRVVVLNVTGAAEFTQTLRGSSVKSAARNTGEALSPCVFVEQPGSAATARAARTAERGKGSFLIVPSSANDPRRDENHELIRSLAHVTTPEQVTQDRNLPEARDHRLRVVRGDLEDAADHGGAAVAHHESRLGVARRERDVLASRDVDADRRLALLDRDVHDDGAFVRDLWRDVQSERRVDVEDRGRIVDGRLDRDLEARLDRRQLAGLRLDLRRGDDLDETTRLGRVNRGVERERVENVREAQMKNLRGTAGQRDVTVDRARIRKHEAGRVPMGRVGRSVETPRDADRVRERAVRFYDPRLDHDLRTRDVEVLDEIEDGREVVGQLFDDERVGTRVDEDVTARRHDLACRGRHLCRVRVGDLLEHRAEGAVLVLRLDELEPRVLLLRQLVRGGDAHDVSLEHIAELVDLEDQLEGLVPRNVLQADGDRPTDVRVEDDVQLRQLAEPLERVLDIRVFQVERDRLARVLLLAGAVSARLVGIRDLVRARGAVLLDEKRFGSLDQGLVPGRRAFSPARLSGGRLHERHGR